MEALSISLRSRQAVSTHIMRRGKSIALGPVYAQSDHRSSIILTSNTIPLFVVLIVLMSAPKCKFILAEVPILIHGPLSLLTRVASTSRKR